MADRMDVNSVLMQMRQVKDQLRAQHSASSDLSANATSAAGPVGNPFQAQLASQMQSLQQATQNPLQSQGAFQTQMAQTQMANPVNPVDAMPATRMNAYNQIQDGWNEGAQAVSPVRGDPAIPDFQTMMGNAVNQVNQNQKIASDLARRFEQGEAGIDLPEVMIAMQKSSVSFQAMTQVRNKLVEAYKDVMNMPV